MHNKIMKTANENINQSKSPNMNQSNSMPFCIINVNQIHINEPNSNNISSKRNRNNEIITSIQLTHAKSTTNMVNNILQISNDNVKQIQLRKQYHRNPFSVEEDNLILYFVSMIGENDWKNISIYLKQHNFNRSSRQCKERYYHYLNPNINKSLNWTSEEDEMLIQIVEKEGKRWKIFEKNFPGRTEVSIRNRYNLLCRQKNKKQKRIKKKVGIMSNEFAFLDSYYSKKKNMCTPKNDSNLINNFENKLQETNHMILSEDELNFDLFPFDDGIDDFQNFDDSFNF